MLIFQWTILKLSIIYFGSLESLLSLWGASCEHQRFLCSLVTLSYKPRCDDFDHFHQARTIISWGKKQDALGVQRERKLPWRRRRGILTTSPCRRWMTAQSDGGRSNVRLPFTSGHENLPSTTRKLVLVSVPFVHLQVAGKGVMSKARVRAELIRPRRKRSHKFVSSVAEGGIQSPLGPQIQCG